MTGTELFAFTRMCPSLWSRASTACGCRRGCTPAVRLETSQSRGGMCTHQELNKPRTAGMSAWAHLTPGVYHQHLPCIVPAQGRTCHWSSRAGKPRSDRAPTPEKGHYSQCHLLRQGWDDKPTISTFTRGESP